ncbi:hypothetical protein SK128_006611, partial [Halocaridina rubra]
PTSNTAAMRQSCLKMLELLGMKEEFPDTPQSVINKQVKRTSSKNESTKLSNTGSPEQEIVHCACLSNLRIRHCPEHSPFSKMCEHFDSSLEFPTPNIDGAVSLMRAVDMVDVSAYYPRRWAVP